jgi:XisH protein
MPRRDGHHEAVKRALQTAGWTITHDPLPYRIDDDQIFIDLGAERVIGAERGNTKIAVEIKSFLSPSPLTDLQEALGQFILYQQFLAELEPDRIMILPFPKQRVSFSNGASPSGYLKYSNSV